MGRYILSNKAIGDLGDIWNFTFDRWSEKQAVKYYRDFLDAFQELADNPGSGRNYDEVRAGLKGVRTGRHIVFFIPLNEGEIEIIRILHERMDLKSRFQERMR